MSQAEAHDSRETSGCKLCRERGPNKLDFDFTMAFQPIINVKNREVFAHEALVRGLDGSGAGAVLSKINKENRYFFDQHCRGKAIEQAHHIGIKEAISINFMPNAVYQPENCIKTTLAAAKKNKWPLNRIIFEFAEGESIDTAHIKGIIKEYQRYGFRVAIDDFGAGHAGLNWLIDLKPDIVKIDMHLVRDVDKDHGRRTIVQSLVSMCAGLDCTVIAEGVETVEELETLQNAGIQLFQGFLLAKPAIDSVTEIAWPANNSERSRHM